MSTVSAAVNDTIYVNTTGNDDSGNGSAENPYLTIKKGVSSVNANGTIHIANGTYSGAKNTRIQITKNMSIIGESQTETIIKGTDTNPIFTVFNGATLTIQNLTITNVTTDGGGAIYNNYGTCNVINCTFTGNTAQYGGAIYNNYGTCNVNSCTFTNNTAAEGGAIYNNGGIYTVINCTFTNNTASRDGGAIYNQGTFTANFNRFYYNTSPNGNAIYNSGGTFDANYNWWGYNSYPKTIYKLIVGSNVNTATWVILSVNATPGLINNTENATVNADLNHYTNSTGYIGELSSHIPEGFIKLDIPWGSFTSSRINHSVALNTVNGVITVMFYANEGAIRYNPVKVTATADTYTTTNAESAYINIYKNNTYLEITGPTTGAVGTTAKITLTLKNNDISGAAIAGETVYFTFNGTTYSGTTNSTGQYSQNIVLSIISGSYTINATYLGSEAYNSTNANTIINVYKNATSIVVASPVHNYAGQNVTLIATVTSTGSIVNGGTVQFQIDGSDVGSPITVNGGTANYIFTIPSAWFAGNHNITALYDGTLSSLYNSSTTTINGTLTVDQTPTSIIIGPVHNFAGQLVTLTANVKDFYNQSVNGGSVIFTINGVAVVKSVTSGISSIDWTIPNWNVGEYVIDAVFNGTGTNYANSSNSSNLTVDQTPTNIKVNPVHNLPGGNVTLTANVKDFYNQSVNGGSVIFTINGVAVVKSVTSGIASIDWTIPSSWSVGDYLISAVFNGTGTNYVNSTNSSTLTVDKIPTNLTTDNITGNKGKSVTLNATLTDYSGTPLNNKIVEFYIDNVKVGESSTNSNGIAVFNYNITQIGGTYNITAKFLEDTEYLDSIGNGTLKVNQSSIYVNVTASKTNPNVGETITLTFKLGNNGPDPADDVIFTYVIPEGMEFVSIDTEPGYPQATYNATTRTITWPLGTVPILDPWIKLNVLILNSRAFNINPTVTTSTYDPTLGNNIQKITINAIEAVNAASTIRTIGMQETGLPAAVLILAMLAVIGGLLVPKRK